MVKGRDLPLSTAPRGARRRDTRVAELMRKVMDISSDDSICGKAPCCARGRIRLRWGGCQRCFRWP